MTTIADRIDRCGNLATLLKLMMVLRGHAALAPLLLRAAARFKAIAEEKKRPATSSSTGEPDQHPTTGN